MAGREKFVIPIFVVLFSICGFTMGMSVEVLIFVPIGIAVARSIGYDIMTGTAMIVMGSIIGFTAGIYNPFNVGVAQVIAQLPLFSGSWLRWILLAVLVVVTCWYITHYAVKVKRDPSKDLLADVDMSHVPDVEFLPVTTRHKLILLTVVAGFSILIYGVSSLDWFIVEMAATFLVMGVVCGFIGGMTANEICDIFVSGASQITYGALIVGVAGTIQTVMIDGKIIDTSVNSLVNTVVLLPGYLQIVAMFLVQTIINLPINSGTGQAAATMPIMIPVADLLGISRQSAVLAFQLGDGFTNAVYPTSSTMLGFLAASRIPYDKWLKYAIPLVGIYSVVSIVFLVIAQFIAY